MKCVKYKKVSYPRFYNYKFVLCIGKHMWLFGKDYQWSFNNELGFNNKKMYGIYIWQKVVNLKKRKMVHEIIRLTKHFVFSPLPLLCGDFDGDTLDLNKNQVSFDSTYSPASDILIKPVKLSSLTKHIASWIKILFKK